MFDAISRWLCKRIFTNAFIEKLINENPADVALLVKTWLSEE